MNRVAYCYLTDFKNDLEMFAWSEASLRHYCGDVDVFVCTAGKRDGAVDISDTFHAVYGKDVDPLAGCAGNRKFPLLVFGKFILGMCPEFAAYDRIVVMDGDIEVVDPRFADLGQLPFPKDADVGMPVCVDRPAQPLQQGTPQSFLSLWSKARVPYTNAGLVVLTPRAGESYVSALRDMLRVSETGRLFLPEEYPALVYLRRWLLPSHFHRIPSFASIRDGTQCGGGVCALHYSGPKRKSLVRDGWRRRAEETYR